MLSRKRVYAEGAAIVPSGGKRRKVYRRRYLGPGQFGRANRQRYYAPVPRNPTSSMDFYPLGYTRTARLKYADQVSVDAPIGQAAYHTFSVNGLYDPDITGVGHQPYGHDQLMLFYQHYTVTNTKITLVASNDPNGIAAMYFIRIRDTASTSITNSDIMEQPLCKWKMAGEANGPSVINLSMNWNARQFFGDRFIVGDFRHTGSINANPSEDCVAQVGVFPQNVAQDLSAVDLQVVIEYTAVYTEPRILVSS